MIMFFAVSAKMPICVYVIMGEYVRFNVSIPAVNCYLFLAHLSRRLTRRAYSIPMVRHRPHLDISEANWPILIKFNV